MVRMATPVKPNVDCTARPRGAPAPTAANMAMPCQEITSPVRGAPARAMPQLMVPVMNRLSPTPISRRPMISRVRLAIDGKGSMSGEEDRARPTRRRRAGPSSTARRGPAWSARVPAAVAYQHGDEGLDADHPAHDSGAEAQRVVDV